MQSPRLRNVVPVAALASLAVCAGCVGDELGSLMAGKDATSTAASDHACPKGRVHVLKEERHPQWTYLLDVCGTERFYFDRAGKKGFDFVESLDDAGAPLIPGSPPPVPQSTAPQVLDTMPPPAVTDASVDR